MEASRPQYASTGEHRPSLAMRRRNEHTPVSFMISQDPPATLSSFRRVPAALLTQHDSGGDPWTACSCLAGGARRLLLTACCSPHDLRRSDIGGLLDAGADLATVRAAGGMRIPQLPRASIGGESGPSGAPRTSCMCP